MPKLAKNGKEQNEEGMGAIIADHLPSITITTDPVIIIGVNRRVGLAHYEHIDLYAGVALPVTGVSTENMEELKVTLQEIAAEGFNIVSAETYTRYKMLVDAQRPPEPSSD